MEASSPLAAMQPTSFLPAWGNDHFTSHPHAHFSSNGYGASAFDFRDISMRHSSKSKPDYFQMKPVRGSSPTASLAADLSQNFHIDMSPQLPTPRRSLFTSNLFGTFDGRQSVTTPPLPSSSPSAALHERMDISPLPHKQTFFATIDSPTPAIYTETITVPSSPPRTSFSEAPREKADRKKSLLRPAMSRTKGYSTNSLPQQAQLPAFRFGAGSSKLSSTSMTMDELFMESPPKERRPQSANSPSVCIMGVSRAGKPFGTMNSHSSKNTGSPIGRRSNNPLLRPRKQFRRSLSMFDNSGEFMKSKEEALPSTLHTVMDIDELHQLLLPHFFAEGAPDSIPRISQETLLQVLDGHFDGQFDQRMIVDCRFEYEFEGGHIDGAVNYNDKEHLAGQLFEAQLPGRTLLIFHCEYSAHRAPIMARYIRKQDRTANAEQYPKLSYPEVYLLEGGYSAFFSGHQARCVPQNYVEMDDKEHAYTCEREMGRLRQNRSKLSRAQTFAFGQGEIDDSPTGPNRSRATNDDLMMTETLSMSPIFGLDRGHTRRMVSY